jgi:hypothetical protein
MKVYPKYACYNFDNVTRECPKERIKFSLATEFTEILRKETLSSLWALWLGPRD